MTHTVVALNLETLNQLLMHAPEALARQAKDDAERIITGLCFTENDIQEKCEEHDIWKSLSAPERTKVIELLLESEYQYATASANDAISEAVEQHLDELQRS